MLWSSPPDTINVAHLKVEAVEDLADQEDGTEDDMQGGWVTGVGGGQTHGGLQNKHEDRASSSTSPSQCYCKGES